MDAVTLGILEGELEDLIGDVGEQVTEATENWLEENIDPNSGYALDRTLAMQNAAAPADMVGDLKSALTNVYETVVTSANICDQRDLETGSLKSDGTIDATATSYRTTKFIPVETNTDYEYVIFLTDGRVTNSRKYVALYDESKVFVSGSYQNVNNVASASISTGSAKYVRVSCSKDLNLMIVKGTTAPTVFYPYTERYVLALDLSDETKSQFASVSNVNLYDSTKDVTGSLTATGNIDATGTSYKTTGSIPIKNGLTYTISPRLRFYALYTGEAADSTCFVSRDTTERTEPYSFTANMDGYLRVSYNTSYPLTTVISTFSGSVTKKIEEAISLSNTQKEQIKDIAFAPNILWGKKWAVCGDSFTNDGGTGTLIQDGKYKGDHYTYPWIIGNRQNMDIVQFFDGGRTLAFPAQPDDFTNSITCPTADWYYQNIPVDTDYITIYLGINDEHHAPTGSTGDDEDTTGEIPLGTITDATTATYYGAWNVVLSWLIENRPNAHIGIIVTNGIANNDNYRLAQIAIAKKYGIPYIDMNGDARTPAMLRTSNPDIDASVKQALIEKWSVNYPSNQHPNDAAQLFESTFIENFLRSI